MFTVPTLLALTLSAPVPADRPPEKPPVFLSVGIPAVHGQRVLPLGGSFPVVVTNTSDKPVKLWRDWCSWGYSNLTLGFENGDREPILKRVPREWSKNYPDAAEVGPGESMVFTVTLSDKEWQDLKFLAERVGTKVKMRVHYRIPADADTAKHGVWSGALRTEYREYKVEQTR